MKTTSVVPKNQGGEFAHSLIAHSLIAHSLRSLKSNEHCERFAQIAQDKWATVSESLRSLMSKEWQWANCSGRSWQKSNRERFAQVAHDKWANKRFAQKIWLKSYFLVRYNSLIPSFLMSDVIESLRSLTKNEQCGRIAQVAHQQWTTMSELLRSVTKNERIARFFEGIAHSLIFFKKSGDSLRKPMSEFPALQKIQIFKNPYLNLA